MRRSCAFNVVMQWDPIDVRTRRPELPNAGVSSVGTVSAIQQTVAEYVHCFNAPHNSSCRPGRSPETSGTPCCGLPLPNSRCSKTSAGQTGQGSSRAHDPAAGPRFLGSQQPAFERQAAPLHDVVKSFRIWPVAAFETVPVNRNERPHRAHSRRDRRALRLEGEGLWSR